MLKKMLITHRMYRLIAADILLPLYFLTKGRLFIAFLLIVIIFLGNYAVYELKYKKKRFWP